MAKSPPERGHVSYIRKSRGSMLSSMRDSTSTMHYLLQEPASEFVPVKRPMWPNGIELAEA